MVSAWCGLHVPGACSVRGRAALVKSNGCWGNGSLYGQWVNTAVHRRTETATKRRNTPLPGKHNHWWFARASERANDCECLQGYALCRPPRLDLPAASTARPATLSGVRGTHSSARCQCQSAPLDPCFAHRCYRSRRTPERRWLAEERRRRLIGGWEGGAVSERTPPCQIRRVCTASVPYGEG